MAVTTGTIVSEDINITAREVDFVTSFASDVKALMEILGIVRPIEKQAGTSINIKTVTGSLNTSTVAEGDEIPLSHYEMTESPLGNISYIKTRTRVSMEAIAEKGYENAVAAVDEEYKSDLRNNVMDKLYTALGNGSTTFTETSFQKTVAMAIGYAKDQFKKMHKTATGMVVFVNTLDVYEYLGDASISMQTAFGFDYVENFLGADVAIISSEIEPGTVIATPVNNLMLYYINPASSDFSRAGLKYTVDTILGVIGYHVEGNYGRASSESFAIGGLVVAPEYANGIAVGTIGSQKVRPQQG